MADETQTVIDATADAATQAIEAAGEAAKETAATVAKTSKRATRNRGESHEAPGEGHPLGCENRSPRKAAPQDKGRWRSQARRPGKDQDCEQEHQQLVRRLQRHPRHGFVPDPVRRCR